jgi:hypothetical protein
VYLSHENGHIQFLKPCFLVIWNSGRRTKSVRPVILRIHGLPSDIQTDNVSNSGLSACPNCAVYERPVWYGHTITEGEESRGLGAIWKAWNCQAESTVITVSLWGGG